MDWVWIDQTTAQQAALAEKGTLQASLATAEAALVGATRLARRLCAGSSGCVCERTCDCRGECEAVGVCVDVL